MARDSLGREHNLPKAAPRTWHTVWRGRAFDFPASASSSSSKQSKLLPTCAKEPGMTYFSANLQIPNRAPLARMSLMYVVWVPCAFGSSGLLLVNLLNP